jgi:hypothetical protein
MLDHDLGNSSFPPARFADQFAWDRQRDVRGALLLTARALERADPVEVAAVLGGLRAGSSVAEVLASLEDLAG